MSNKVISVNKLLKTTDIGGDCKSYFYIQTKWLDDQILLKLQDSQTNQCYSGSVSVAQLKESANELNIPYNEYYEECRQALTTYIALPGCTYKLDEDDNAFKIWKSEPGSIPMLYLEIPLKTMRHHYDILDTAVEELQNQNKALSERVEKAHKFDEHSRALLDDYRLCVEEKNKLERRLLRKVAALLNTKKQKIAELEERLSKYENVNRNNEEDEEQMHEDDEDSRGSRPESSKKRRKQIIESETEDEDDFNAETEPLTMPEVSA
ncbi:uncharacterized protein LOC133338049 [Musca vetustissima]|uniref:uncharacterized protein LOC133338049 n=1 Tax=Musca vetustissima TaxID=27455 RepID=UPI002AB76395|nr:uncharacterized protein LOC133338049 [Musca vetustissima]